MTYTLSFWIHFFLRLFYDFYDAIYNSHNSLISILLLILHMVWKVSTCGDLASLLTNSWLGTGLRSRVTQSQHLATSVQWTSRLHICCWERWFFQTSFFMSIGLLMTGKPGPPPLTLPQLTYHWSAPMVPLFAPWRFVLIHTWCDLSIWRKFFSSVLKSTNIYYVD